MLLLDEPSNDLDVETLRALEDALLEYAGTVMVISHDRWFWTVLPRISWPLKATRNGFSLMVTIRNMRLIRRSDWAKKALHPSVFVTRR